MNTELKYLIEMTTGANFENVLLVVAGFFWCFFGIVLRKLYKSTKDGKTLWQFFKETPNSELLFKAMLVIAAMRFFRLIFDTDQIAFAGFMIGLSLDVLPSIIFAAPKYFTSKFDPFIDKEDKEEHKDFEVNQNVTINISSKKQDKDVPEEP